MVTIISYGRHRVPHSFLTHKRTSELKTRLQILVLKIIFHNLLKWKFKNNDGSYQLKNLIADDDSVSFYFYHLLRPGPAMKRFFALIQVDTSNCSNVNLKEKKRETCNKYGALCYANCWLHLSKEEKKRRNDSR